MTASDPTRPFTVPCRGHKPRPAGIRTRPAPPPMTGELEHWLTLWEPWPEGIQAQLTRLNERMIDRKDMLYAAAPRWPDLYPGGLPDLHDPVMQGMRAMHRARVLQLETPAARQRRESICLSCGQSK